MRVKFPPELEAVLANPKTAVALAKQMRDTSKVQADGSRIITLEKLDGTKVQFRAPGPSNYRYNP
jgi:hypothetical protein